MARITTMITTMMRVNNNDYNGVIVTMTRYFLGGKALTTP